MSTTENANTGAEDGEQEKSAKKSVATLLVEMAGARYRLGLSEEGEPFAVERDGPNVALMLRGGRSSLRASLAKSYMASTGKVASAGALADALMALEGMANGEDPVPLPLRVTSPYPDHVLIDLGDTAGRVVLVSPEGWEVLARSRLTFRRTALTMPLPVPQRSTFDLMGLRMLNVSEKSWPLVVGWLVAALIPDIPHPVLMPKGEQGTGKTTAASFLARMIDPSPAPVRAAPRDLEQWAVAASGSYVVALDNLSGIAPWMSDALCRASTGEGLVRRALYTDGDLSVLRFRKAVILTAIDAGALRGDLADRLVTLELERIEPEHRRTDADLEADFTRQHPILFGALLDLLARVLDELRYVHLPNLPRMADFAKVLAALDATTGRGDACDASGALNHYLGQSEELAGDVIAGDPVAAAVADLAVRTTTWTGTAASLLEVLTPDPRPKGWPGAPHVLTGQLKRAAPALRTTGVEVDFSRVGRRRIITITARTEKPRNQASQASQASSAQSSQGIRGDAPNGNGDAPPDQASPPMPKRHTERHHETAGQTPSDACDAPIRPSSVVDTDSYENDYADLFAQAEVDP